MHQAKHILLIFLIFAGLVLLAVALRPRRIFDDPVSAVLESRDGQLLGARIAADGQWRFPPADSVPERFAKAIVTFEDKRFWHHPGIDPLALGRALRLNTRKGEVRSGASTLTMQTIRLSRGNQPRTVREKLVEMVLALRLEAYLSKDEILALYTANAPFGGNVVGLEAAAWRYFGRSADELSWAETAMLAVLVMMGNAILRLSAGSAEDDSAWDYYSYLAQSLDPDGGLIELREQEALTEDEIVSYLIADNLSVEQLMASYYEEAY